MNGVADPWSRPWHARLRMLAQALYLEGRDPLAEAAKLSRVRVVTGPSGSWLRRRRLQAPPVRPNARRDRVIPDQPAVQ